MMWRAVAIAVLQLTLVHGRFITHPSSAPLKPDGRNLRKSPLNASAATLKHQGKKAHVEPVESYRYTIHEPAFFGSPHSLILLGPWNGSSGFFDEWLLNDFAKMEPGVKNQYRILDVVARKMGTDEWNPYPYNSWYEYQDWHNEIPFPEDVDKAVEYVHSLLMQEFAVVGDYGRIILAGFSQGANVALESALRFPHKLGLVFSQRGILLESRKQDTTPIQPTPYVTTAGEKDDVYLESRVKENARWLQAMGAPAYMKALSTVDHYRHSKRETDLAIKSCVAMTSAAPQKAIPQLTTWTDFSA